MSKQYRLYCWFVALGVLLIVFFGSFWGYKTFQHNKSLNQSWLEHDDHALKTYHAFSEFNRRIGYGGFIHDFKNLVLRQDSVYMKKLDADIVVISGLHAKLKTLLNTEQEQAALQQIMSVLEQYFQKYEQTKKLILEGTTTAQLDNIVRVNDLPAINGQEKLLLLMLNQHEKIRLVAGTELYQLEVLLKQGAFIFIPVLLMGVLFILIINRLSHTHRYLQHARDEAEIVLQTTPNPVMAVNSDGKVIKANNAAREYFGYGDNLLSMQAKELMPGYPSSHDVAHQQGSHLSTTSLSLKLDSVLKAQLADGQKREISVQFGFFNDQSDRFTVVSLIDVTEENAFKIALLDAQKRIDLAAGEGHFGIWDWHVETDQLVWDKWMYQIYGINLHESSCNLLLWKSALHPDDRERAITEIERCLAQVDSLNIEFRIVLPDGQIRYLQCSASIQCNEAGRVVRMTGINFDVTDRKKIEMALIESKAEAEAASQAKSEFLANMSHEIRTPMNAVLGMLTLLDNTQLQEKQRGFINSAHSAAGSLLSILNDILDFSKLEVGKVDIVENDFALDDVLHNIIDLFGIVATAKSVELHLDVKPDVYCQLVGDSLRINQILNNLVSNALKFTSKGSVMLRVSTLDSTDSHCQIMFSVIDTGIGLNAEQISQVAQAFVQADMSTTRDFGGTGLGLSICAGLLELMGSKLKITSEPGRGSEFSFALDLGLQPDARTYANFNVGNKTVLMVMYDQQMQAIISQYFPLWGIDLHCCNDLDAALVQIEQSKAHFDLLLTDFSQGDHLKALKQVCNAWAEYRHEFASSIILIADGTTDDIEDESILRLHPIVMKRPPSPSRLFDAMSMRRDSRSPLHDVNLMEQAIVAASDIVGSHILVVEDVLTNQLVAIDFLESLGMNADVVENGALAIESVKTQKYDAVLMDFHMPVMDGLEATRQIRKLGYQTLPIIAMTAAAFEQDKIRATAAGMNAHIAKPINIKTLADMLAKFIPAKNQPLTLSNKEKNLDINIPLMNLSALPDAINPDAIMQHFLNNQTLFYRCLHTFADDFSDWADEIQACYHQSDYEMAKGLAHKLKGAAGSIAATDIYNDAMTLQASIEENLGAETLLEVCEKVNRLCRDIQQHIPRPGLISTFSHLQVDTAQVLLQLQQLKESIDKQRYIPSEQVEACLAPLPDHIDKALIQKMYRNIESFEYNQATDNLQKIIQQLQRSQ